MTGPAADRVERFAAALARLVPQGRLGVAVSGGPDSLALLALAHAHCPDRIEAVTVDHRLRAESGQEAEDVAALCAGIGVPHAILRAGRPRDLPAGPQASAREHRYALMAGWAEERRLGALLTAHHADDQAETLLMRLARGAGLAGMSGIRETQRLHGLLVARPLLGFTRAELGEIVAGLGWRAAEDPSNRDDRYDRTRARAVLAGEASRQEARQPAFDPRLSHLAEKGESEAPDRVRGNVEADAGDRTATPATWLDPLRIGATARHLAQAEEALAWVANREAERRLSPAEEAWLLDPEGVPSELLRRLVLLALARAAPAESPPPPGPDVERLIARLRAGRHATLAGVAVRPGPRWRFAAAPPHRSI